MRRRQRCCGAPTTPCQPSGQTPRRGPRRSCACAWTCRWAGGRTSGCSASTDAGRLPCPPGALIRHLAEAIPACTVLQHEKEELEAAAGEQGALVATQRAELAALRSELQRARADGLALAEDKARLEVGGCDLGGCGATV